MVCTIFDSGLPLSLVENEYFIAFYKKLRPAELLNKTYKNVTENINQYINEVDLVCIISDSWTNLWYESIINFIVTTSKLVF